jgi:hypothetical protein
MTESLKDLLVHQAASVAFKPPDLDAIARDNRRNRRRRAATVIAAVAAVAVMAGTAVVLSGVGRGPDVVADPRRTEGVSWAVGSRIYDGHDTVEVGHDVRAYVRTSLGFVTVDAADNVYSVTSRGVARIGQAVATARDGTEQVRLVSDPHGTLAGWVGVDESGLVLQVHDQATGQTRTYDPAVMRPRYGRVFYAIDDRTAYWRPAARGVFAVDLDTGDERQLAGADQINFEIWGVEDGVLAFSRDHQPGGGVTSFNVGRSVDNAREFTITGDAEADDQLLLSPTGAWLTYLYVEFNGPPQRDDVRAFALHVRDTNSGELVTLDLPLPSFAIPVVWLDDTSLQLLVIGFSPRMYVCTVPDGSCDIAADVPRAALDDDTLILPNGVGQ